MEEDMDKDNSYIQQSEGSESAEESGEISAEEAETAKPTIEEGLQEQRDKYLRLYAEFENYKKRVNKDKEDLVKYGNESLLYELLPVIDNLEMAIRHSTDSAGDSLVQGVEITLKEFLRIIDRFGLKPIPALDKAFDPAVHHAMTQIERDDVDENTVVEEYRKGYMFRDKVLRPSLVAVSKKKADSGQPSAVSAEKENTEENIEEEE